MNSYFISPFIEFKRAFENCYTEHKYTKQLVLLPCEVREYLSDPMLRLFGLGADAVEDLKEKGLFDFLLAEGILLERGTAYSDISNFMVRPRVTYLGLPFGTLNDLTDSFAVFGVPYFLGNPMASPTSQPHAVARNYSQKYNLQVGSFQSADAINGGHYGFADRSDVLDLGDIYINQRESPIVSLEKITDTADRLLQGSNRFLAIGGDHSITYPLFKGVQKHFEDLVCLQIDAHNDLFLLSECQFGDLAPSHSSVVAKLLQDGVPVHTIGIRDFVNVDSLDMVECGTYSCHFTRSDAHFLETLTTVLADLGNKKVYLTLDIDVLDPRQFSSVTDPLPNGISLDTLSAALHQIAASVDVVAMDVVEAMVSDSNPVDTHNFLNLIRDLLNIFYGTPKRQHHALQQADGL